MFGFIRLPNVGFGSSLTDKIILSNCRPNLIGTLGKIAGNVEGLPQWRYSLLVSPKPQLNKVTEVNVYYCCSPAFRLLELKLMPALSRSLLCRPSIAANPILCWLFVVRLSINFSLTIFSFGLRILLLSKHPRHKAF